MAGRNFWEGGGGRVAWQADVQSWGELAHGSFHFCVGAKVERPCQTPAACSDMAGSRR
jgi:hypothetical protein